jgi:superfamily I DNA/RNA helicase
MKEIRVFGSPGTGKTTFLQHQISHDAEKFGAENILVASFTKTAAQELASRVKDIPEENVATLHAHCFRALGNPKLTAGKHLTSWNEEHPAYALGNSHVDLDDPLDQIGDESYGNNCMKTMEFLRNRMTPRKDWPANIQAFSSEWEEWKEEKDLLDFTDLIEMAPSAPRMPQVGIYDECQDFTPLQLNLVRKWGNSMDHIVMASDPDQMLYSFLGAEPHALLTPSIPDDQKRILHQSYRVPRAVHTYAVKLANRISYREPKDYRPRDADGKIQRLDASFQCPESLLNVIKNTEGTTMILAPCGYMLNTTIQCLKEAGIPFHNPYRRKKTAWNPLSHKGKEVVKIMLREDRLWSRNDLKKILPFISSDILIQGAKTRIDLEEADETPITPKGLQEYFQEGALGILLQDKPHGDFFLKHAVPSKRGTIGYALEIARRHGYESLDRPANTIVGTIHSVKGGQADTVVIFPDLSTAGMNELDGRPEQRDAIYRQFYVGVTRAKTNLVLCEPATRNYWE